MKEKTMYKSQNREELLSFLSSRPNTHFTVAELVSHFQADRSVRQRYIDSWKDSVKREW